MGDARVPSSGSTPARLKVLLFVGRIAAALLGAGLFNLIWLAVFILAAGKPPRGPIAILLWCVAPVITALGFSYGMILFNRLRERVTAPLSSVLPWPLAGCVLGAAIVVPFWPMFIGAAMFALGGAALVLREALVLRHVTRGA